MPIYEIPAFWQYVDYQADGCWEWTGARAVGYGHMTPTFARSLGLPTRFAHRAAYTLEYGPIPKGLMVCHHCDNPPCCRPDHLFLGTSADNLHDARRKGRLRTKLTDTNVRDIRAAYRPGSVTLETLSAMYGVSTMQISRVVRRIGWQHVA